MRNYASEMGTQIRRSADGGKDLLLSILKGKLGD
jgi:hypothetical protein